jgi:GIY-YIG catalytic domain
MVDHVATDEPSAAQAKPPRLTLIYTLSEPDGTVRYIGKTMRPLRRRLVEHMCYAVTKRANTYLARWIRELHEAGLVPVISQIDEAFENWAEREAHWIDWYWSQGARLTNLTPGGDGVPGHVHSPETRRVMSEKATLRFTNPAARIQAGLARKGKKDPPEELARKRIKGRIHTAEARANMSAGRIGIVFSPETIERMRVAAKARHANDPSSKAGQIAAMKIHRADPTYIAAQRALWDDPDYRARLSAAKKIACDNPKFRARMSEITTAAAARRRAAKAATNA